MDPPKCKNLVLDAGPLLSLSPLRGMAETFYTVPQVLAELNDNRAKEHFERLGLMSGVNVTIRSPDTTCLAHVTQWAKKTGDYSVLSHPDLCVLALTYMLHEEVNREKENEIEKQISATSAPSNLDVDSDAEIETTKDPQKHQEDIDRTEVDGLLVKQLGETSLQPSKLEKDDFIQEQKAVGYEKEPSLEPLQVELIPVESDSSAHNGHLPTPANNRSPPDPIFDDPSDSDDGEGEWITPENVAMHKSRALSLLPEAGPNSKGKNRKSREEFIGAGCMTADFAMQNVLLQMGLNLIGTEGMKIERLKTWVLRCHACFKICKDNSKKFCPSCGNPTLLRTSITISSPTASKDAPEMQIHLKKNFQYKVRGSKYSIPAPKPGSAKTGPGEGLVLREDQAEYLRAKKRADGKRQREETKLMKNILSKGVDGNTGVGSWMDPDWIPEMISTGSGGKGRTMKISRMDGDLPQIGYGKKNPNETRRRK